MARVLLLDLFLLEADRERREERAFIQSFLYLGAYLESVGVKHDLFRWYGDEDELVAQLEAGDYGYVFISALMGPMLGLIEPAAQIVRRTSPGTRVWVGGVAVRFIGELLGRHPLVDHCSLGHPRHDPARFHAELRRHGVVPATAPWTGATFPPLASYSKLPLFLHEHSAGGDLIKALNLSSSAGCSHKCSFCHVAAIPFWQQPVPELVQELHQLQEGHAVRYFEFSDDNFADSLPRLEAFAASTRASGVELAFFCLASADRLTRKVLDLLVAAGMKRIFVGVDTINARGLKLYRKPYIRARAVEAIEMLREYPVDLTLGLVLGAFGETRDDLEALHEWVCGVEPEICAPQFLTVYPQTPIFESAILRGFEPPDSLSRWAQAADQRCPKPYSCVNIDVDEYLEWDRRFERLGTRNYRSGIGESKRRLDRETAPKAP